MYSPYCPVLRLHLKRLQKAHSCRSFAGSSVLDLLSMPHRAMCTAFPAHCSRQGDACAVTAAKNLASRSSKPPILTASFDSSPSKNSTDATRPKEVPYAGGACGLASVLKNSNGRNCTFPAPLRSFRHT